jgi:hypothetical protein
MLTVSKSSLPNTCYFCACAFLFAFSTVVFLFFPPAEHDIGIDFWEHVASVKQLMTDPIHPLHPQYLSHDPSRQYMPWYLLMGMLGRAFGWAPLRVMAAAAILTTVLWLVAIRLFFQEYFENSWASLAGLTCLFFMWGTPWVWSSFYNFRSYLTTAAYPSSFVFGLTFIVWWVGIRAMRCSSHRRWAPVAMSLLVALALLVHQLSACFAVAGLICLLVGDIPGQWRRKVMLIFSALVGMASTAAWPYFNPWQIIVKDQVWNPLWAPLGAARFYQPLQVFACIGPAFAGSVGIVIFALRRVHLAVVLGFVGALLAYLLGNLFRNPMTHRALILVILCLHMGLSWLLFTALGGGRRAALARWRALLATVAIIVVAHLAIVSLEIADIAFPHSIIQRLSIHRHLDVVGSFKILGSYLSPNSVALATPEVCKALPAFQGRVVSVYWTSPLVRDDEQRGWDSERFFSQEMPLNERREIIARYRVTHIIFQSKDVPPGLRGTLRQLADDQAIVNGIILMKVKS